MAGFCAIGFSRRRTRVPRPAAINRATAQIANTALFLFPLTGFSAVKEAVAFLLETVAVVSAEATDAVDNFAEVVGVIVAELTAAADAASACGTFFLMLATRCRTCACATKSAM